jgi:hypothetical protein
MNSPFLTVAAAAARACVSEDLVRAWVRDGLLLHLRVGVKGWRGKILIDPLDLDALLASFKVGVKPPVPTPRHVPPPPLASAFAHLRLS